MKLAPTISRAEIEVLLKNQSDQVYGPERTSQLTTQIEHLSRMLAEVASREIDLTGSPPATHGIAGRHDH